MVISFNRHTLAGNYTLERYVFYYFRSFINCQHDLEAKPLFSNSLSHFGGYISVFMSKIVLYGHSVDFVYLKMYMCIYYNRSFSSGSK